MAMNMPALEDECRTTLIVVPAALLQQVSPLFVLIRDEFQLYSVEGRDQYKEQ